MVEAFPSIGDAMSTFHPPISRGAHELLEPFLAGDWSQRTRKNYAFILAGYRQWCTAQRVDALRDISPGVVESWIAALRGRRYAPNTIAGRVSAVSAFYRWCVREQLIDRNPIDAIRRPARPTVSTTVSLTRLSSPTGWPRLSGAAVLGGRPRCCWA
jgi:integrase